MPARTTLFKQVRRLGKSRRSKPPAQRTSRKFDPLRSEGKDKYRMGHGKLLSEEAALISGQEEYPDKKLSKLQLLPIETRWKRSGRKKAGNFLPAFSLGQFTGRIARPGAAFTS